MNKQQHYLSPEQFDELKLRELEYISRHRYGSEHNSEKTGFVTGLALSGGGIRSATFNLGVLQALAKAGFLEKIDYLSTVSGGSYIGSSLTWFLSSETQQDFAANAADIKPNLDKSAVFGTQQHNFPYGTDEPGQLVTGTNSPLQNTLLEYLRNRGNFLTPGDNYTMLTLIAVALRTGMLSLMTWVPLITLFMLVLILPDLYIDTLQTNNIPVVYKAIGVFGLLASLAFVVAGILMAGLISFKTNKGKDDESFKFRLLADKLSNGFLISAMVSAGIYFIAWLGTEVISSANIINQTTYLISVALMLIGIVAGLITLFKPDSQLMNKVLLPLAASLLAFGILFCAYQLAYAAALQHRSTIFGLILRWDYFLASGVVIALFLCTRTNLNDISIARFYRDRLKETFMPDSKSIQPGTEQNFSKETYLKDMCQSTEHSHYQGPYHIINANVILVESNQKKYSRRGGDNFIFSPLYCGSHATGWRETSNYFKGELTLATAMAISGAAVNPNSGAGGRGITRNKVVSFVLSILNLRMGLWCPNPDPSIQNLASFYAGNFLQSAWYSIKSWIAKRGYHEHAACIQVSDGGHFENLGVYELIRRELDLIIVTDASADPAFTFANFRNALRLAESDLNVEISLDKGENLSRLMPDQGKQMDSPMAEAEQGFLCANILYKNKKQGRLIYLKSTMTGGQRIRTKSYKLEYPRFPDQPTSDQFFDESQFAAYRDLGYAIASDMIDKCDL